MELGDDGRHLFTELRGRVAEKLDRHPPSDELVRGKRRIALASRQPLRGCLVAERSLPARVGVGQDEPQDPGRVHPIELLRQEAAPRQAQDVCALHADFVEERGKTGRPIGDRERIRRVGGFARAGSVPGHDRESVGEVFQFASPHSGIAKEAMEEHQGRTTPRRPVGDRVFSDLDAG